MLGRSGQHSPRHRSVLRGASAPNRFFEGMAVRISIVIPTRNRPAMAALAVRAALDAAGPDDEVIVADNGDAPLQLDGTDARLRTLRAERVYSMPDNWERGVRAARGQDLLVLSDKHRLVPGSLGHLLAARRGAREVVSYTYATFFQKVDPGELDRIEAIAEAPGMLEYVQGGRYGSERSSPEMLRDWYATVRYRPDRPMLYSALVPREIVDDVVRSKGRFFQGMAPDVSSGLHILGATRTYVETNIITVLTHFPSADSRWSNGLSVSKGTERGSGFLQEFVDGPLGRLPPLTSAVIYQTIVEFARLQPEQVPPAMVDISRFARAAAIEIECADRRDGAAMHWALFKATQATGLSPRSFFEQARTVFSSRVLGDRWLARRLKRLISKSSAQDSRMAVPGSVCARSLNDAIQRVAGVNHQVTW